jgi:AraC-like DNA-binding protein
LSRKVPLMQSVIIQPQNQLLKKYVQYFLFFRKSGVKTVSYTTFPNNNLCLAIYKQNNVDYINTGNTNSCIVRAGSQSYSSRLYGFHKTAFQANIYDSLDQICIIFYPSAIRAFTGEAYHNLLNSEEVFDSMFHSKNTFLLEKIFDHDNFSARAALLEQHLFKNLHESIIPVKLKEALHYISQNSHLGSFKIEELSKKLSISDATLFRLFTTHLGQNPKSYLKTVRFRTALHDIIHSGQSLTQLAYSNEYYDQSHFIHDCKSFSGYSPKQLMQKISVEQNALAWIFNNEELRMKS